MSGFPRRSARLSPNLQDQSQRSSGHSSIPQFQYSQSSSTSTTSHPSPTNDGLNPPPPPPTPQQNNPFGGLKLQSSLMPQQPTHDAPLPSPSASDINPFSFRSHSQPGYPASQPQQDQSMYGQQQNQNTQQLHPHTNSMNHGQSNGLQEMGMNPGQLPPDFLAEAAKRAQIACLMRDMGDVTL